jgi:hypothetical protein
VHGEEEKYIFLYWADSSSQNKNLFYLHNEPTKEGHLSFVLLESPFLSVSTVSRGQPSLVFLCLTLLKATQPLVKLLASAVFQLLIVPTYQHQEGAVTIISDVCPL